MRHKMKQKRIEKKEVVFGKGKRRKVAKWAKKKKKWNTKEKEKERERERERKQKNEIDS